MKLENLKQNQQKAVLCLMACSSVSEAARQANISESCLWEWMKEPEFMSILNQERETLFQESMSRIKACSLKATDTLLSLLNSDDERIRRSVANDVLDKALKFREIIDLEERISSLEKAYKKKI